MTPFYEIDERIVKASEKAMELCKPYLDITDEITEYHQHKMLKAFQNARVSESCFTASTGYGYGDRGREALEFLTRKMPLSDIILQAVHIH